MKWVWGFSVFLAISAVSAEETRFSSEFFSSMREAQRSLSGYCPSILPLAPGGRPWRFFASETADRPLRRIRLLPLGEEICGACAVLRYPVGSVRLYFWEGDVYGEVGPLVFLLPESEKAKVPSPSSPFRIDGLFVRSAFDQLVNFSPAEAPPLPENFKAEYTARLTDSPFRRGCSMPPEFDESAARAAFAAGANLLFFRAGESPKRQLDTAWAAGLKAVLDCSSLAQAKLTEIAGTLEGHPALVAFDLGGGPAGYERALAVRRVSGTLPLLLSADVFGSPEGFEGFSALPLKDIVYAVDLRGISAFSQEERLSPLIAFQRRNGVRVFVRAFEESVPRRFIDALEAHGWEWCAPYPPKTLYRNCFLRNRP